MTGLLNHRTRAAVLAAALWGVPVAGLACGYHGSLGYGFSAQHPQSMSVAFALRDAADAGVLEQNLLKPKLADMMALHRATQRLEKLRAALARRMDDAPVPSFALLVVEVGMWSEFTAEAGTLHLKAHVDAPSPDRAVVITGDAVVAGILAGTLLPEEAIRRRLIVANGSPELPQILAQALAR